MKVLLLLIIVATAEVCWALKKKPMLTKKYTLRFPIVLPIGGPINPLGDVCTESLDFLLQSLNSQDKILKDYNVVVDVIDDECRSSKAIERVVPELENWKAVSTTGYNSKSYAASLPYQPSTEWTTANTTYTPPVLIGGICSGVCKAIGTLPQHYNLIEVSTACIDPSLDDRRKYPNFYRFLRPLYVYANTRKALSAHLAIDRVAILSDATHFSYNDVMLSIKLLSEENSNVEIAAEEFFQKDPTEAISRLKKQDIRVIFALCFVNHCPAIACGAYKMGYYGPNMIWVFNTEVDLVSEKINRPPGCDKSMTDKFAEGVLFLGTDINSASSSSPSEIGITADDISHHIRTFSPSSITTGAFGWRGLCFETLNSAVNLANTVELMLNSKNDTLSNAIADPSRKVSLSEAFQNAIFKVEFQATWGPMKMEEDYSMHSPPMIIQQLQDLKRVLVLVEKNKKLTQHENNKFKWRTSDGNAPKSSHRVIYHIISTPSSGTYFSWCLSSIMLFSLSISVYVSAKTRNPEVAVVMIGGLLIVIANILFTDEITIDSKCAVIVSLLLIGYAIILGILCFKLGITFLFRNNAIIIVPNKRNRAVGLSFMIWFVMNLALVIVVMGGDIGKPELLAFEREGEHDVLAENVTIYQWKACSSDDFILGYVIIGIQALLAGFGIFCGLITRHQQTAILMRDLAKVRICLFIIFPLTVALLMVQLVVEDNMIIFVVLNIFSLGIGLTLVALFATPKITFDPRELPAPIALASLRPTKNSFLSKGPNAGISKQPRKGTK